MTGASWLTIEDSLIANLPINGVLVVGTGNVTITNTTLRFNGEAAVYAQNGARVSVSGSRMLGGYGGVWAASATATTTTAVVSDSIISGGATGVRAATTVAGASTRIFVTRCTIERNNTALQSDTTNIGSALVTVSGTMITNNVFGWNQFGAGSVIKSLGNNHIQDNTNPPMGVLTPATLQ
jgi:hypothetical protein